MEISFTAGKAIESACMVAPVYLQTENLVIVDDANLAKLRNFERNLLEAKSWADRQVLSISLVAPRRRGLIH